MSTLAFTESELLIDPKELVSRLGKRIDDLRQAQPGQPDKVWTLWIKEALEAIAKEVEAKRSDGLSVEVIYTKSGVGEFLLDLVWWCRKKSPPYNFLGLAVEVEWGYAHAVGVDFSKLTVVKCPLKLVVFGTGTSGRDKSHEPQQQAVLAELDRYLTPYAHHIPGEHYVFFDVALIGYRKAWIRSVGQDGLLSPLTEV